MMKKNKTALALACSTIFFATASYSEPPSKFEFRNLPIEPCTLKDPWIDDDDGCGPSIRAAMDKCASNGGLAGRDKNTAYCRTPIGRPGWPANAKPLPLPIGPFVSIKFAQKNLIRTQPLRVVPCLLLQTLETISAQKKRGTERFRQRT